MNKYFITSLSVAGGVLTGIAWTSWCPGLILLFSFVPFLIIENYLFEHSERFTNNAFFIFLLPGFTVLCIIALGWLRVFTIIGAICVIMVLTFLMSMVLYLSHIVRQRAGNITGFISLIAFWLCFEFFSLNIPYITPWINLGNGLAKDIFFIQWYEITGTGGGSLWILLSNLFLTITIVNFYNKKRKYKPYLIIWLLIIIIPSSLSFARYFTIKQNYSGKSEIIIIQPNVDPYSEKFSIPFKDQLKKSLDMASKAITANSNWVITPETTVDDPINLDSIDSNQYIKMIKRTVKDYPRLAIVSGLVSYKEYPYSMTPPSITSRFTGINGIYCDYFNSAFKIDSGNNTEVYHKSKLVPGVEMQFYNGIGKLFDKILPFFGGTKWGYGTQENRLCFTNSYTSVKAAPIICYESAFGEFVTGYVRNGAEALFIITNDGWWKNTIGYRQHLAYASLRAIETRREVARSANTGISCIIDIRGKRKCETKWWAQSVLKGDIYPEKDITPYVKYGDLILQISLIITTLIAVITFVVIPIKKKLAKF
jgi:apolipoprotein N-acyltransferase